MGHEPDADHMVFRAYVCFASSSGDAIAHIVCWLIGWVRLVIRSFRKAGILYLAAL